MGGPTLLWRDSSAVALAILLWGRGIEALLRWQGGNSGGTAAVVIGVVIDPRGPSPLEVGQDALLPVGMAYVWTAPFVLPPPQLHGTRLSLADLVEVNGAWEGSLRSESQWSHLSLPPPPSFQRCVLRCLRCLEMQWAQALAAAGVAAEVGAPLPPLLL